ncbi:MAG: hypothetical protein R3D81_11665 [Thalassovita sp.]
MPEVLSQTLSIPGLGWMVLAIFLAGMVRGFAGFGTALVALPILGQYVPPIWTIVVIIVADLIGASLNVPRALRDGQPKDVGACCWGRCWRCRSDCPCCWRSRPNCSAISSASWR